MPVIPNKSPYSEPATQYVDALFLARKYKVSSRYILILAAEGRIPSIRLGPKCVRFDEGAVAAVLESYSDKAKFPH